MEAAVLAVFALFFAALLTGVAVAETRYRRRGWKPKALDRTPDNRSLPRDASPYDGSELLG